MCYYLYIVHLMMGLIFDLGKKKKINQYTKRVSTETKQKINKDASIRVWGMKFQYGKPGRNPQSARVYLCFGLHAMCQARTNKFWCLCPLHMFQCFYKRDTIPWEESRGGYFDFSWMRCSQKLLRRGSSLWLVTQHHYILPVRGFVYTYIIPVLFCF